MSHDHDNLPPTVPLGQDPLAIELPILEIRTFEALRTLMQAERHAVQVVHAKTRSFMDPSMQLTGPDGKPIGDVARKLLDRMTDYLHEELPLPTVAEEWAKAPSDTAKDSMISGASFRIGYMILQEFGRLVHRVAPEFVASCDMVLIMGANALTHGLMPYTVYEHGFCAKHSDDAGVPILGRDNEFKMKLLRLEGELLRFLELKRLAHGSPNGDAWELNDAGRRLLNHLCSVKGSTESMRIYGPDIAQEAMAAQAQGETLTGSEVQRALADPNANLPEA